MRDLLAEVHHRPWLATALAGALAAVCALLRSPLPAALAAMVAGLILMWISEEEHRVVAAMGPGDDALPAPDLAPAPAAAPATGSATRIREWASPFPAPRPARLARQQGRRTGGRRA
jgi:hypothetical protein